MRNAMILCVALLAVTVGVFLQTGDHGFITFDDPGYVTDNPRVKGGVTGENVAWAFSATAMSNWHPLTWLSHMLDVELFGLDPRGHHLTNVFFHAASTLLLFFLLAQITGAPWRSLFVAALFALHPLHVESVAWVAERKDVLSGFFWFLTLLLYAGYVKRGGTARYLLALLSFAAGLMAKPMLVTLPVVLLLLDYWPLRRSPLGSLVKEKIPFFLLSAASSVVTVIAQEQSGAMKTLDAIPLGHRIGNAVIAYAKYIGKMFWPADLAMLYPFPGSIPLWQVSVSFLLLVLLSALAIGYRRRHPYLVTGWFWFLATLVPVIGIVQVGGQSMADRYTYLPLTGLFLVLSWGVDDLSQGWRYRKAVLAVLAAGIIAASAAGTWRQAGYWKDNLTLYRHTLEVTDGNHTIRNNYASALAERGDLDAAIREYREVLRKWPHLPRVHNNLGHVLAARGNIAEAISHHNEALRLTSDASIPDGNVARTFDRATAHLNLGNVFLAQGEIREAIREYNATLELRPDFDKAHNNLGIAYSAMGKFPEAIAAFQRAIQRNPYNVDARKNLAICIRKAEAPGDK
jgi:tetratricopeptide (TPR) repeat protein